MTASNSSPSDGPLIRLGHSPDPDDAFMWWPLVGTERRPGPQIDTGGFRFETVAEDIAALNRRAPAAELEVTAMSCGAWPAVADRYALTACGASMGDGYGPKLVARQPMTAEALAASGFTIATPGNQTSAMMTTRLLLGTEEGAFQSREVPFEAIIDEVRSGDCEAGIVIHEAQLTYQQAGLHLVEDLGAWWKRTRGTLLPLGVNAIRRDLEDLYGPGTLARLTAVLRASLDHAIAERDESIRYALGYARDMGAELAGEFIDLYVNRFTLAFGPEGEAAVKGWLGELAEAGLVPSVDVSIIEPAGG